MTQLFRQMLNQERILVLALIPSICICMSGRSAEFTKPKWHDELVAAIKADSVITVEQICSTNSLKPDVVLNANASTPLMVASSLGSREVVKWLLDCGADVKARTVLKDPEKPPGVADCTALHLACARNHVEVARLLIERGADLRQQDGNGNTPFMATCAKGHLEIIKLLMKHGAKITELNSHGWSALLVATTFDNTALAEFLVAQGAAINAEPGARSVLMKASERGNESLVRLLIEKGANVNHTNWGGSSALIDAAVEGHDKIVKMLIQKGTKIDQQTDEGWTALLKAAAHGHCETVKLLCEAGADPTRTNRFEHTAFDYAKGLTGTNVITKDTNLRPLIDNGSIAPDDLYYVMERLNSEGDFDCVVKVLQDYEKHFKQRPKTP